jgi:predicted nucleic acid-binding protein
MKYLLDTCLISETVKLVPSHSVLAWLQSQDETRLYLSVLTIGELSKCISRLEKGARRSRLQDWLDVSLARRFMGRILPIDSETAQAWGRMSAECERLGRRLPVLDGLLAASAMQHGLAVVSRNVVDFELTGVSVVNPWQS